MMCARGPLGQGAELGWWNPGHIAGYVLGGLALVLGMAVLFDWSLPLINSPRAAVLVLGLLMVAKMLTALLYPRLGSGRRKNRNGSHCAVTGAYQATGDRDRFSYAGLQ
ncbi:MAG TPA: hypothetical protein VK879_12520 [Candidatus Sulfomarinibacteraceae bacterium]|nr:hypothetical protein [Candidatus Sulfomarinibacteraceae bacterium]